jgi:hypothetical protein
VHRSRDEQLERPVPALALHRRTGRTCSSTTRSPSQLRRTRRRRATRRRLQPGT